MTKFAYFGWSMVNIIAIVQMRSNIELTQFIKGMRGQIFGETFQQTDAFLVLEVAGLTCVEKGNVEPRILPTCLCSSTFFTGIPLKRIDG